MNADAATGGRGGLADVPTEQPAGFIVPLGRRVELPGRGRTFVRDVEGPPGAPALILLHGWMASGGLNWYQVFEPASRHFRVIAPDLRGHGRGLRSRRRFRLADCADDVAALMDELHVESAVVAGYSMGGPVAVEAARLIGPRVVGVIGVDTMNDVGLPKSDPADTAKRLAAFEKDFIGATREMVATSMFAPETDPVLKRRIVDDMSQAPPSVAIAAIRQLNAWDGAAALKALAVPVVVVNSDLWGVTDEARIRRIAPQFRAIPLAGLGHFLMMEDPARFNPILDEQIRALAN